MPNAREIWLADMDALIALCEAETAWVRDKHRPKSELAAAGFDAPLKKKIRQGPERLGYEAYLDARDDFGEVLLSIGPCRVRAVYSPRALRAIRKNVARLPIRAFSSAKTNT